MAFGSLALTLGLSSTSLSSGTVTPPPSGLAAPFTDDFSGTGTIDGRTGWTYTSGSPTGAGTVRADFGVSGGVAKMLTSTASGLFDYPLHDTGQAAQMIEIDINLNDNTNTRKFFLHGGTTTDFVQMEIKGGLNVQMRYRQSGGTVTFVSSLGGGTPTITPNSDVARYRIETYDDGSFQVFRNGYPFSNSDRPSGITGTLVKPPVSLLGTAIGLGYIALNTTSTIADWVRIAPIPLLGDVKMGFYGLNPATNLATIPISGTYYGTMTGVNYQLVDAATGAQTQALTAYSNQIISSSPKTWSGNMSAPIGVQRAINSFANDAAQIAYGTPFGVGDVWAGIGQSESAFVDAVNSSGGISVNPAVWTFMTSYSGGSNQWQQMQGLTSHNCAGGGTLGNLINLATSRPIGITGKGDPGSAMSGLISPSGAAWIAFNTTLRASTADGSLPPIVGLFTLQGYGNIDPGVTSTANAWTTDFDTVVSQMRTMFSNSNLPIFQELTHTLPTQRVNATSGQDTCADIVRRAQIGKHNSSNKVYIASSPLGFTQTGGGNDHLNQTGLIEKGRRWAYSVLRWYYGTQSWDGRGPIITSATKINSTTIRLALDMNGATSLTGANATHFLLSSNSDMSSPFANSGYTPPSGSTNPSMTANMTVNPNNVSGTWYIDMVYSAGLPGGTIYFASHLGLNYDESSKISGTGYPTMAYGSVADIPVFPAHVIMTVQ